MKGPIWWISENSVSEISPIKVWAISCWFYDGDDDDEDGDGDNGDGGGDNDDEEEVGEKDYASPPSTSWHKCGSLNLSLRLAFYGTPPYYVGLHFYRSRSPEVSVQLDIKFNSVKSYDSTPDESLISCKYGSWGEA